jgi:multicomponent Na+:H+ antiporter subunit B
VGIALLSAGLAWAVSDLPAFGHYHHRYGAILARSSVPARSATNSVVVTAFDFRAFDTLGEEFILFAAVVGVLVLLRRVRGDREERLGAHEQREEGEFASDLQRWLGRALLGPLLVLGAYVITHGHLTPGGGFQGGVLLMGAVAAVFVGGDYRPLLRLRGHEALEAAEAAGAAGFALLGFGGLLAAGIFMQNFIAKGVSGLLTGGFMPIANIAVGIEVGGALLLLLSELLDKRLIGGEP